MRLLTGLVTCATFLLFCLAVVAETSTEVQMKWDALPE